MIAMTSGVPMKPGSSGLPMFGVLPAVLDSEGNELEGEARGELVFKLPWPGMAKTFFDNHECFTKTHFTNYPGYYWSGDGK